MHNTMIANAKIIVINMHKLFIKSSFSDIWAFKSRLLNVKAPTLYIVLEQKNYTV